ncbi:DUF4019 domain-containing protein [Pseudomonas sp. No.21]|uniref:DUF4019 domain-containing protein n=1 Tax=Pseudomonas tohonis TaxID=2725477 RepID=UPI001F408C73|nr:DUF4019 domain-containing protein [Pseudomonas tohonis]GJN47085.1 hypothetical protein TUM20249_30710 [Pseudomonas tohonis]
MKMLRSALLAFGLLACTLAQATEAQKIEQAKAAAGAWLAIADSEDYLRSWQQAASLFRHSVTRYDWINLAVDLRSPLGAVRARTLQSAKYATQLPGLPDGEYVILEYRSNFEHHSEAVETVTPMRDTDGQWRVAGYYVD